MHEGGKEVAERGGHRGVAKGWPRAAPVSGGEHKSAHCRSEHRHGQAGAEGGGTVTPTPHKIEHQKRHQRPSTITPHGHLALRAPASATCRLPHDLRPHDWAGGLPPIAKAPSLLSPVR
eukprot:363801-Chlamydomonas_euryale.AAC.1